MQSRRRSWRDLGGIRRLIDRLDEVEQRETRGVPAERGYYPRPPPAEAHPLLAAEERPVDCAEESDHRSVLHGLAEDQVERGGLGGGPRAGRKGEGGDGGKRVGDRRDEVAQREWDEQRRRCARRE